MVVTIWTGPLPNIRHGPQPQFANPGTLASPRVTQHSPTVEHPCLAVRSHFVHPTLDLVGRSDKSRYRPYEIVCPVNPPINAGEPDVGDLVQIRQMSHHDLADPRRRDLRFERGIDVG